MVFPCADCRTYELATSCDHELPPKIRSMKPLLDNFTMVQTPDPEEQYAAEPPWFSPNSNSNVRSLCVMFAGDLDPLLPQFGHQFDMFKIKLNGEEFIDPRRVVYVAFYYDLIEQGYAMRDGRRVVVVQTLHTPRQRHDSLTSGSIPSVMRLGVDKLIRPLCSTSSSYKQHMACGWHAQINVHAHTSLIPRSCAKKDRPMSAKPPWTHSSHLSLRRSLALPLSLKRTIQHLA
jgi:hypothetical protein